MTRRPSPGMDEGTVYPTATIASSSHLDGDRTLPARVL